MREVFVHVCQVVKKAPIAETLQLQYPPSSYYTSYLENDDAPEVMRLPGKSQAAEMQIKDVREA
jgi:hypothetical protein